MVSTRALNRALLARQLLLERQPLSPATAVARLVAVQAQLAPAPFMALWARLPAFESGSLAEPIRRGQVVKGMLLRPTLHLVRREDAALLWRANRPALERSLTSIAGKRLRGLDLERLVATARAFMEEGPRTWAELTRFLGARFPDREASALAYAVRMRLPLGQVPAGGRWGYPGNPSYALDDALDACDLSVADAQREVVRRYLAGYGPATVADIQAWAATTGLRPLLEGMAGELRSFSDPAGRTLHDLPEATLPDPETPVPPRFLPEFDNVLLAHADRSRIVPERHRARVFAEAAPRIRSTFLVDGFVAGAWKLEPPRRGEPARLLLEPWEKLPDAVLGEVAEEGSALAGFLSAPADVRVEVADAGS